MSVSLFDLTVTGYLQTLNAVAGLLDKGKAHFEEQGVDLDDIVQLRLIDDMNPMQFQVISVAHHSMGALKGLESGEFTPPNGYGEPDYAGLKALISDSIAYVEGLSREQVEGYSGKTLVFKIGGNEIPFTAENFIMSFSIPNFQFHATTTYDLFRMKGLQIGKMDYLGQLRMGA